MSDDAMIAKSNVGALDALTDTAGRIGKLASEMASRLEALATRLDGPYPTGGQTAPAAGRPEMPGKLTVLHDTITGVGTQMDRISAAVERLERLG